MKHSQFPSTRCTKAATAAVLTSFLVAGAPAIAAVDADGRSPLRDDEIVNALEEELLVDPAVLSHDIDIEVVNGIVTLTGTVSNLLAKERSARIAEAVRGARSVVNRIAVEPKIRRDDRELERDVEAALFDDPATDAYELSVSAEDGRVTLAGTVESWSEKELAASVAKGVFGVVGVVNEIVVDYRTVRPDSEIEAEIERSLQRHALIDDGLIAVDVENAKVTLDGVVGSAAEKRLATWEAWTAGVDSVDATGLEVERWARDPDLRSDPIRSQDEIRAAIEDAWVHDPRVFSFDVAAEVSPGGTATLSGAVDNVKAKRAAEQDARNTVGVVTVRNFIKVRPSAQRTDDAIEADIESALLRDPYVNRYDVGVAVFDGVAYLAGDLDSHFEKGRADDAAARVKGVVDVVNNIAVQDPRPIGSDPWIDPWSTFTYDWYRLERSLSYTPDWEIRENIESQLEWSPFVDADDVTVTVEDAVATLTGTVDTWLERGAARDNAYDGGATYVRNRIEVD